MPLKLVAIDLDGTALCSDHQTLSPANRLALQTLIQNGVEVAIATGRTFSRLPQPLLQLPGIRYAITSNGAAVWSVLEKRVLSGCYLSAQDATGVLDALWDLPLYIEAYCDGCSYSDIMRKPFFETLPVPDGQRGVYLLNLTFLPDLRAFLQGPQVHIEKIHLPYIPQGLQLEVQKRLSRFPVFCITTSLRANTELNAREAVKGNGLAWLCRLLGIRPDEAMAIGDNQNDLSMLQFAGVSAAPANAAAQIQRVVDYVSTSNDQDGVANAVKRYFPQLF